MKLTSMETNVSKNRHNSKLIAQACQTSDNAVDNKVYRVFRNDPVVEHAYCMKYLRALANSLPIVVQKSKSGKPKNLTHNKMMKGVETFESFLKRPRYWFDRVPGTMDEGIPKFITSDQQ